MIIEEYLSSGETKNAIWKKHTGREVEHGAILRWMRTFGYIDQTRLAKMDGQMKEKSTEHQVDAFEIERLKKQIAELELKLKDAEFKAIAFSTMIDVAEDEFKLKIRKKFNTKPFKK